MHAYIYGAGAAEFEEEGDAELPERHSRPAGHAGPSASSLLLLSLELSDTQSL